MADWVVIVDDDLTNLKVAGHILSKYDKKVTTLTSGKALPCTWCRTCSCCECSLA